MARKLILYKGILPNTDNSVYLCKNRIDLISYLENYKITELELESYRINANVAKVKVAGFPIIVNTINSQNYDEVTYIIDYDSIGSGQNKIITYFKAYHVENAVLQSGMAIYTLSVDNWANYYNDFKDANINVLKCNRNIDVGVFDTIETNGIRDGVALEGGLFLNAENFNVLFIANVVTAQRLDGQESVTGLFALTANIKTLANLFSDEERNDRTDFELAIRAVSGITSINAGLDVSISKVFVVPTEALSISSYYYELQAKTPYTAKRTLSFNGYIINANKFDKSFTLPTLDANRKYIIGTLTDGLEIPTYTKPVSVHYTFISSINNLQVIVGVGDIEKDITASFDIGIVGSAQQLNTLEKMSEALSGLSKVIKMSFGAFNSKTPIVEGIISGLDFAGSIYNKVNAKGVVPNGNANVNFINLIHEIGNGYWIGGSDKVLNPYILSYFNGIYNDTYEKALLFGANYNNIINFENIFNFDFITTQATIENTYIKGNVLVLDNIPKQAQTEIINKIRNGIYCKQ